VLEPGFSLLTLLQTSEPDLPNWVTSLQASLDMFQSALTGLGILIGGLFAYYRFAKGRTFAARLELTISGVVLRQSGQTYFKVTANAKNSGLSRVRIDHEVGKTGLIVQTLRAGGAWSLYAAALPFQEQDNLEPGQSVGEPFWFHLTERDYIAVRLRLAVFPRPRRIFSFRKRPWVAQEIVNVPPQEDNKEIQITLLNELKEGFKRWRNPSRVKT